MAIFKLPRLPVRWEKNPELTRRYWDEAMTKLESTLNAILSIPAIIAALADLDSATQAALDAADAAQAAADNAQSAANDQARENSIVNSYVDNYTSPLISANLSGGITIANHDRVYGDQVLNPTVSVTGGMLATAAPPGSIVRVYYIDSARSGGSVSYLFTVDPAAPPVQGGDTHSVGAVEIPSVGFQDGRGMYPPGFIYF